MMELYSKAKDVWMAWALNAPAPRTAMMLTFRGLKWTAARPPVQTFPGRIRRLGAEKDNGCQIVPGPDRTPSADGDDAPAVFRPHRNVRLFIHGADNSKQGVLADVFPRANRGDE
jgi:hypothetical protein